MRLTTNSFQALFRALRSPICPLRKLKLNLNMQDDHFLELLRSTQSSRLELLSLFMMDETQIRPATSEQFATLLPTLTLCNLTVDGVDGVNDIVFETAREAIYNGIKNNGSLERLSIWPRFDLGCQRFTGSCQRSENLSCRVPCSVLLDQALASKVKSWPN